MSLNSSEVEKSWVKREIFLMMDGIYFYCSDLQLSARILFFSEVSEILKKRQLNSSIVIFCQEQKQ